MTTTLYVPGTDEKDHKKQNMSLQLIGGQTATNTDSIATNTTNIATNTTNIATNTSNISTIINSLIGSVIWHASTRLPTNHLLCDGSAVSRTTYATLFGVLVYSSTVTFTNASANIGWTSHGMSVGDKVKFFTTGTLPTNFTAGTHGYNVGTEYFVKAVIDANTFTVSATVGGSAITAGSAGSGTQTGVNAAWGDGDGSTTFTLPKLVGDFIRAWDASAGIDANRGFGVEQLDAMQGHVHQNTWNNSSGTVRTNVDVGVNSSISYSGPITSGPISDGTNGTPRTAAETRPRNQVLLPCIRYA